MKRCIPFLILFEIVFHLNVGSAGEVCAKLFEIEKKGKTQNQLENEFLNSMRWYFKKRATEGGILFTPLPVKAAVRIRKHWDELDSKIGKLQPGERITIPMYYADLIKEAENIGVVDIVFCLEKFVEMRRQGLETNQSLNELFGKLAQSSPRHAPEINRARFGDVSKLNDSWSKPSAKSSRKKEKERKKEEERKRRQAEELEKQKGKWLGEINDILKSNREIAKTEILDYLNLLKVKVANKGEEAKLALTFGYGTAQENAKSLELARKIIEDFDDGEGKILIDGDSPMGREIAQIDPRKTLLISGSEKQISGIEAIVVKNDYLRMKLFKNAKKTVTSIDSPIGLGVIFNEGDVIIYDPEQRWTANLQNWSQEIPVKLGLPSFYNSGRERSVEEVLKAINATTAKGWGFDSKYSWKESEHEVPTSAKLEDLSASKIADILNTAVAAEKDNQDLTRDSSGKPYPGGAVVFGSSQNSPEYTKMIWDITNYLASRGVTIATGGSGGYMEVANDAAFSAGAHSIGIPIGGRHSLKNEKTINSDLHTVTIPASGYEDRIPNLLHRRKMIVFAPGGSGTMKELATAFFKVTKEINSDDIIVFMGKDYYGTMFEGLQNSALPVSVRAKLFLIDSVEDTQKLYEWYEAKIADKSSLRTAESPVPRNSHKTFRGMNYPSNEPFYKKFENEKDWTSDWKPGKDSFRDQKDYKPGKGFFSDEDNYDWD